MDQHVRVTNRRREPQVGRKGPIGGIRELIVQSLKPRPVDTPRDGAVARIGHQQRAQQNPRLLFVLEGEAEQRVMRFGKVHA